MESIDRVYITMVYGNCLTLSLPLPARGIECGHPLKMKKIDIREHPDLIEAINDGLNKNDDLNLKVEPKGITLVRQTRKVIYRVEQ